ncbi:TldD/PmbA family protein [bacterium]|nr:TldD/PmbA family protein [bacterium]
MKNSINKEYFLQIIDNAKSLGVQYADIRRVHRITERIKSKNSEIESIISNDNSGFGIRVLVDGCWGFAGSSNIKKDEMKTALNQAIDIAKASSILKKENITLSTTEPIIGHFETAYNIDPFKVSFKEKLKLLLACNKIMKEVKNIHLASGQLYFQKEEKLFISTEGSEISQIRIASGGGIAATAMKNSEVQKYSYPTSFGGDYKTGGYEVIENFALCKNALNTAKNANELLKADECPNMITNLILGSFILGIHIHETCGHPTELDRVIGSETSYAGTSFLLPDMIGKFQYGSKIVNLEADATLAEGMGTFFYDDEGVKAQKFFLVKDGIFSDYLTSRETASLFGKKSNGTMRADGWGRMPLIRMTNINLLPGAWELNDLIRDTHEGIFMDIVKSWSIDDRRWNFQFGSEIAYEIKNGMLSKPLKNSTYTGNTEQFWNSCDAICNKNHWKLMGVINCSKGEPGQAGHISHGSSPARFRNISIGVN